VIIRPP